MNASYWLESTPDETIHEWRQVTAAERRARETEDITDLLWLEDRTITVDAIRAWVDTGEWNE